MQRRIKNKRGDIPLTVLVIGIILICCIAIFSFFFSAIKERNSLVGISLTEKIESQIEEKIFNNENSAGLYLEENTTKGILLWKKQIVLFSVKYEGQS
jgi:hypothetical protein